ncbi:hypothetical protein [Promineifilum sp.]|uniref:hypothetical protein n=1 Tax=Promineifilum sp. TaxID=2664178 RepID=UPI0035AD942B
MSDTLFGIIGLAIFLVVVFVAGYFLYKFKNARLTGAWGPLVGLVNGQVVGDGGAVHRAAGTPTEGGRDQPAGQHHVDPAVSQMFQKTGQMMEYGTI